MEQVIDIITSTDLSLLQMFVIIICIGIFIISYKTISLLNSFTAQLKATSKEKLSASQFKIFNTAVDSALKIIIDVVKGLNEELVNDLKAKASDGKLTEEERIEILNNAVAKIKSQLSTDILNNLSICISDIDSWLVSVIHKTLGDIKLKDKNSQQVFDLFTDKMVAKNTGQSPGKSDDQSEASLEIKQG